MQTSRIALDFDLLLFAFGHLVLLEQIKEFKFIFRQAFTDMSFLFIAQIFGKIKQIVKIVFD
jgi:hypothetical protein